MTTVRAVVVLTLVCFHAAAEQRWIRLKSPNFDLYSTSGERSSRNALERFERVRAYFLQASGARPQLPVRIVLFRTEKEYEPYRPNEFARAFFLPGLLSDQIVIGGETSELLPIAIHEYVHLLVRQTGMTVPVWLNEGIAELYSTMEPRGDKVLVGTLIPARVIALREKEWIPLHVILEATHDSPFYNEKEKAGSLYNEAWALTHMLSLSPAYRDKYDVVIQRIGAGLSSEKVLQEVYGKPLAMISKDLRAYLEATTFSAALMPAQLVKTSTEFTLDQPSDFDVQLTLALIQTDDMKALSPKLDRLAAQAPDNPDAHAILGMLRRQENNLDAALPHLRKAVEGGVRSPRLLRDTAQVAAFKQDLDLALLASQQLLVLDPTDMDARLMAVGIQLNRNKPGDALALLGPVKRITPQYAPRFFQLMAYSMYNLKQYEEAKKAANRWLQLAGNDQDKAAAERMMEALANAANGSVATLYEAPADTANAPNEEAGRPTLTRTGPRESRGAGSPAAISSEVGEFTNLECNGTSARLTLKTVQGTRMFFIQDPGEIVISQGQSGPVELSCGAQNKPRTVRIGFVPPPEGSRYTGLLREITFDPQ